MIEPNTNTKTIREIILWCDTLGLSTNESIEIINKIIEKRSLPDFIDKDAIKLSEIRYYKHKEALYKPLQDKIKGSIYDKPAAAMLLLPHDMKIVDAVNSAVVDNISKETIQRINKELIALIKSDKLKVNIH